MLLKKRRTGFTLLKGNAYKIERHLSRKYYHEPRSGRQFRSRKEVEKFIQMGEVPRSKPKPEIEESNVENISSQISEPTPSSDIARPLTLELYGKHLPSFMGGGKSNQQSEVGGPIIEQDVTESTIGIQQPVLGIEQSKASSSRAKKEGGLKNRS